MNGTLPINQVTSANAPFSGNYIPEQPFSNLTGPANGIWTLNVSDRQSGDIGKLLNWSLTLRVDNQIVTYIWNTGHTGPQILVSPTQTTTFVLTVTDLNGCQSIASHQIIVINQSNDLLGNDTTICQGQSITFDVGSYHNSILWHNNSTNSTYTVTNTETVSVIVQNQCGIYFDTVQVTVLPTPIVNLGSDTTICVGNYIILDAGSGYQNYIWSNNEQTQTIQVISQIPITSTYAVTVTDQFGCTGSDQINITFQICSDMPDISLISGLHVYPNPSEGMLYVKYDNRLENIEMTMLSIDGKLVAKYTIYNNILIDLTHLQSGVYVIIFSSNHRVLYKTFLVKK